MRLHKFLAHAGVASRRAAEEFIAQGKVRVNGKTVRTLGTSVDDGDEIAVDGKIVALPKAHTYIVLNKPLGVVTTMRDPEGRRTVADLLPKGLPRIVPVGRLDYDTSGVLLLTNDGELAHVLTHPRFGVEKTYRAVVRGELSRDDVLALERGMRLQGLRTSRARVKVVASPREQTVLDITIHEGGNRQVRRMLEAVGHPVRELRRLRFGPIALGALGAGRTRPATAQEIARLRELLR